jgi:hypothetical protein
MPEGTTPVETSKHNFKNFDEARAWAYDNIIGTHKNDSTGEVWIISKKSVKKYVSASAVLKSVNREVHLSALVALPQIIRTSLIKEVQKDKRNNPDVKEIQRFYGTLHYEGNNYPVKMTVKATINEGNKAYSYEVLDIENPTEQHPSGLTIPSGQQNVSDNTSKAFSHLENADVLQLSAPQR